MFTFVVETPVLGVDLFCGESVFFLGLFASVNSLNICTKIHSKTELKRNFIKCNLFNFDTKKSNAKYMFPLYQAYEQKDALTDLRENRKFCYNKIAEKFRKYKINIYLKSFT